jgi:hypothetical protein
MTARLLKRIHLEWAIREAAKDDETLPGVALLQRLDDDPAFRRRLGDWILSYAQESQASVGRPWPFLERSDVLGLLSHLLEWSKDPLDHSTLNVGVNMIVMKEAKVTPDPSDRFQCQVLRLGNKLAQHVPDAQSHLLSTLARCQRPGRDLSGWQLAALGLVDRGATLPEEDHSWGGALVEQILLRQRRRDLGEMAKQAGHDVNQDADPSNLDPKHETPRRRASKM